jgi:hypothetical protein
MPLFSSTAARFERLVDPYPAARPVQPPAAFFPFLWRCTEGLRPQLLAVTLLTAGIAAAEALLFSLMASAGLARMPARARLRDRGAADARRHRRTLERCGRAGAAQTRGAPAVQSGSGQGQVAAAASRGRSWMLGGDLVNHPG